VANRVSDKLTQLHHSIYCCRSGSAADTQALSDYVRYFLSSHRCVCVCVCVCACVCGGLGLCPRRARLGGLVVSCVVCGLTPLSMCVCVCVCVCLVQRGAWAAAERVHGVEAHVVAHLQQQGQPDGCVCTCVCVCVCVCVVCAWLIAASYES
jgi:hypothetical protein